MDNSEPKNEESIIFNATDWDSIVCEIGFGSKFELEYKKFLSTQKPEKMNKFVKQLLQTTKKFEDERDIFDVIVKIIHSYYQSINEETIGYIVSTICDMNDHWNVWDSIDKLVVQSGNHEFMNATHAEKLLSKIKSFPYTADWSIAKLIERIQLTSADPNWECLKVTFVNAMDYISHINDQKAKTFNPQDLYGAYWTLSLILPHIVLTDEQINDVIIKSKFNTTKNENLAELFCKKGGLGDLLSAQPNCDVDNLNQALSEIFANIKDSSNIKKRSRINKAN